MEEIRLDTTAPSTGANESINVRNAYKKYQPNEIVLNGLNLTVANGSIYALLGPSGCGKTTLLNCIVGQTSLDAGSIRLRVTKRSEIGYMPQFLSLHAPMTIFENFYFYGYLFGMSTNAIKERAQDLISFLELPDGNTSLKFLSGGQQRRVSIAIALIHRPRLLILDEPTVGLDPILCQNIWSMLLDLIKEGKSVLITTHYIQEAGQAHTIGLMRGGILLAEEPPAQLTHRYECNDLEEVFLRLSHQQEIEPKDRDTSYPEDTRPVSTYFEDDTKRFTKAKYFAVMYKNLTFFRRELAFIVFIIILPTVQAYIFNLVIGVKPKNIKLGIINEEISFADCNQAAYEGCFLDSSHNVSLSCLFLEYLQKANYSFVNYEDKDEALRGIKKNEVWGILEFPQNYTHSLASRVADGFHASVEDVANSLVNTWIDLSNQYIGSFVKYDVTRSMISLLKQALSKCGKNPKMGTLAMTFEKPVFGSYNENFISYASAAMICLCCFFSSSTSTAMLIVTEKSEGMMERMLVAGATMFEMVMSLLFIQMVGQMISIPLVMLFMFWIFGNPLTGSVITLASLLGLTGFTGVLYGTTLAVFNTDLIMTAYLGVGLNIVMILTTGLLWPIEAEHYLLKCVTWMLPLTWIADAARGICLKSYSIVHPIVLRGFASATVWNLIFLCMIYYGIRRKKGTAPATFK